MGVRGPQGHSDDPRRAQDLTASGRASSVSQAGCGLNYQALDPQNSALCWLGDGSKGVTEPSKSEVARS